MPNFAEQSEAIRGMSARSPYRGTPWNDGCSGASVVVIATFGAPYILWELVDLLLLLFACALVSLILLTITNALRRRTGLPFGAALTVTVLSLLVFIVGAITFFGTTIQSEFAELAARLPAAWVTLQQQLRTSSIGTAILVKTQGLVPASGQAIVSAATTALAAVGGALSGLAIVLVGGLYLAAQPTLYSGGCSA